MYPTGKVQSADPLTVYNKYKGAGEEYMVSGSDDFTLFLWHPAKSNKPVCRMTGHQQLINQVTYLFVLVTRIYGIIICRYLTTRSPADLVKSENNAIFFVKSCRGEKSFFEIPNFLVVLLFLNF